MENLLVTVLAVIYGWQALIGSAELLLCILLNACNYAIIKSTELLKGWRTVIRQKQFKKLKDLLNLITVTRIDEI